MLAQNSDSALTMAVTDTHILPRKIKDDEKNKWENSTNKKIVYCKIVFVRVHVG